MNFRLFKDRADAGRRLSVELLHYGRDPDAIVLALPRGGVPVAFEVAGVLNAPLDVFVVRKLGVPEHPELAMGALATGGACYLDHELIEQFKISGEQIEDVIEKESAELLRREDLYRQGRPPLRLESKNVILVDDGLATGATLIAAVRAIKIHRPKGIVVAVPVAAASSVPRVRKEVDALVTVETIEHFRSVGQWYGDFSQTGDEEVERLLAAAPPGSPQSLMAKQN